MGPVTRPLPEPIGPVFEVLVGDEDPAVRRTAVQILAGIDSEDALAALEGALFDPDTSYALPPSRL